MRTISLLLLVACGQVGIAQQDAKKDGIVIPLDKDGIQLISAQGRWPKFEQGQKRRVHIWFADDVWHLRCTCPINDKSRFDGTVTVDKGSITVVGGAGNVPAVGKSGKLTNAKFADYLQKIPNGVSFLFRSAGKLDGIDFKVPREAKKIRFEILVDNDPLPGYIFIGAKGEHPSSSTFTLDAHP